MPARIFVSRGDSSTFPRDTARHQAIAEEPLTTSATMRVGVTSLLLRTEPKKFRRDVDRALVRSS
jgi:hypothetical protein